MSAFDDLIPQGGGAFDDLIPRKDPKIGQPEELSFAERFIAPILDKLGTAAQSAPGPVGDAARVVLNNGNARGGAAGRVAMGLADPGVSVVQMAANALPNSTGAGRAVNDRVANVEDQYQAARKEAGSEGFDSLRLAGNVGMNAFVGAALPAVGALDRAPMLLKAPIQGAGFGVLQPVTDGGEDFWREKEKEAGIGALAGFGGAAVARGAARVVSPKASVDPKLQALRDEGVTPSVGQSLGGMFNSAEEKAQSIPFLGALIAKARQRGGAQLEDAAYGRAADPIGATVTERGYGGISELRGKIGDAYEKAIPQLSVDALSPGFIGRLSSLRGLVQSLPKEEAQQFDSILQRELGDRMAPNGVISGQNLKDAWNAFRDLGNQFSKSNDAYQSQLGRALKQTFNEIKTEVSATNPADKVMALKNADLSYANFKRLERAASYVGAEDGRFTPAQLQSAVKAMDNSKDKGRFASGDALMQDLSGAGKAVLSNKVPDSGTAGRQAFMAAASLGPAGLFFPHITAPAVAGMGLGALAYTRPVQNFLSSAIGSRPASAPRVANGLRRLATLAPFATVPSAEASRR